MSVCLYTFHGYGTWWPDNSRGYTTKDEGVLPPDQAMADYYRDDAKFEPVNFNAIMQQILIAGAYDICQRRDWRLHAVGTDPTHGHFLISQPDYFDFIPVRDKWKNLLSLFLGRHSGITRTWFATGGSNKQVKVRDHFDYLVTEYLPNQRGLFWKEGQPLPELPKGIL